MADTHEKKVEKKVVREPAPKAPEHGQSPAPKAAAHPAEHAAKEAAPVKKLEARPKTGEAAPRAEPKPAPKAEQRPAPKAEDKSAAKKEGPGTDAPAGEPSPQPAEKTPPAGETGEVEAEIVEEPGEKKPAEKPRKKKGKKERRPRIRPELSAEVVKALALRKELKDKTPHFIRQEAYNYGRLDKNWRRPRGTHSKLRHHINYRINVVSIGYGGPNASKGMHPSGFREVLVHHPLELDRVDPKTQAARIAHGVGVRKRTMIEQRAQRKGIRVLNEMREE
jgi:large subunit ribosomal protein L32e